jgi:hypothetical protein
MLMTIPTYGLLSQSQQTLACIPAHVGYVPYSRYLLLGDTDLLESIAAARDATIVCFAMTCCQPLSLATQLETAGIA